MISGRFPSTLGLRDREHTRPERVVAVLPDTLHELEAEPFEMIFDISKTDEIDHSGSPKRHRFLADDDGLLPALMFGDHVEHGDRLTLGVCLLLGIDMKARKVRRRVDMRTTVQTECTSRMRTGMGPSLVGPSFP